MKNLSVRKQSVRWLAKEINEDPSNLSKQLREATIKHDKLFKICIDMEIDYFSLYSAKCDEIIQKRDE